METRVDPQRYAYVQVCVSRADDSTFVLGVATIPLGPFEACQDVLSEVLSAARNAYGPVAYRVVQDLARQSLLRGGDPEWTQLSLI